MAEVAKHNTKTDCWTVVENKVYNITPFVVSGQHNPLIVQACGIDATSLFTISHEGEKQVKTDSVLKQYYIGDLS